MWRQLLRARYCPPPLPPTRENPRGLHPLLDLFVQQCETFCVPFLLIWKDHCLMTQSSELQQKSFSTRNLLIDIPTLTNWAKNRAAFMSQLFTLVTYILSFSSCHVYQKAPRTSSAAAIAIRIKDSESFVRLTFPKSCCEDGIWLQPRITNLNGVILYDRSRKRDGRYFSCNSTSIHEIREL